MDGAVIQRERHSRKDGYLVELFSNRDLSDFRCRHSYFVVLEQGATRAKHYHNKKTEIIAPVYGKVELVLKNLESGEERKEELSLEDEYKMVIIHPNIAHAIKNKNDGRSGIIVFSDSYDLEDTHQYEFEEEK